MKESNAKEDAVNGIYLLNREVKIMDDKKTQRIENTISMLMRLDGEALILIENSALVLKKYQDLKREKERSVNTE